MPGVQLPVVATPRAPLRQAPAKPELSAARTAESTRNADAAQLQARQDEPTQDQLKSAVDQANKAITARAPNELRFSIDEDTGVSVVKIVDQETGETLRQIPAQEMLEIAKSIDQMKGLLVRQEA